MGITLLLVRTIGILDGDLGLADAPHSLDRLRLRQGGLAKARRLARFLEGELLHQLVEQVVTPGKMGIAGIRNRPERNLLGGRGTWLHYISRFALLWRWRLERLEQPQLLSTGSKERAQFDAVIRTGLLVASFPALHCDERDP